MLASEDRKHLASGLIIFALLLASWYWALVKAPTEAAMGEVYRIIYLHVPSAFTAFFSSLVLCIFSVWGIWKKDERAMVWGKACAEVGFIFTLLTLATGSIWGRPTWGVWWTWDARLTTTLLLALLYAGYLILYGSLTPGAQRTRICSVLGILIFADVPIIYKSVTWWRALHQPPTLMRPGGATIAPEMFNTLMVCLVVMLAVGYWMMRQRAYNMGLEHDLEKQSYASL